MNSEWVFLEHFHVPESVLPSWQAFDVFRAPGTLALSWTGASALAAEHAALEQADIVRLIAEIESWNAALAHCGGDPAVDNWLSFRPLRTEREEDWSDWLQHLIVTSRSSRLLVTLLGSAWRGQPVDVRRELPVGDRRADLVVRGPGGLRAQIEVKVGDRAFAKTDTTAALLEAVDPGQWAHVLLVPPWDAALARAETGGATARVTVRTWDEVAVILRVSLWRCEESVSWCVWARAFCGAIEQRLLGLSCVRVQVDPASAGMLVAELREARFLAEGEHE